MYSKFLALTLAIALMMSVSVANASLAPSPTLPTPNNNISKNPLFNTNLKVICNDSTVYQKGMLPLPVQQCTIITLQPKK